MISFDEPKGLNAEYDRDITRLYLDNNRTNKLLLARYWEVGAVSTPDARGVLLWITCSSDSCSYRSNRLHSHNKEVTAQLSRSWTATF